MPDSRDPELRNDFLRLLAQSEAAIRTFLRAILYSQSDTDEAFQNTLITLWDKFEEYDTKKDFKPWAFGIARFKALSIIRDRQREKLVFGDNLLNQFADDTIAAGDRYLTQEEALDGCLMKLPESENTLGGSQLRKSPQLWRRHSRLIPTYEAYTSIMQILTWH